ncbi:MAG: hypothetical protein IKD88_01265 [Lachnospiraceae bacterium]|nr:hypothetical protein [Lachnospiraceae bacterium]
MKKTSKKLLSLVLALVFAATLLPVTAHAEPAAGDCTRNTGTYEHNRQRFDPLEDDPCAEGHSWGPWLTGGDEFGIYHEPPTCTEAGEEYRVCSRCGTMETRAVPAGHIWSDWQSGTDSFGNYYQPPTCTEDGVEFRVCSRCEQVATRSVPALGHNWNAGTVTREATCTAAGERTYQCTRCSQTRTEAIPALGHDWGADGVCRRCGQRNSEAPAAPETPAAPVTPVTPVETTAANPAFSAAALFSSLRNIPTSANTLVITQQPSGGSVTRDAGEGFTLSVAVEGGEAPYTYEWYCKDLEAEEQTSSIAVWASDANASLSTTFQNTAASWYADHAQSYADAFDPGWFSAVTGGGSVADLIGGLHLFEHDLGGTEEPFINISQGNCEYWVVITDNAGHSITSDRARVSYRVRIAEQPRNANWRTAAPPDDYVRMECQAADGSGEYFYEWFRNDERDLPYALYDSCEIMDLGTYVCRVTDLATGDTVESEEVEVYDVPPLLIYSLPSGATLWSEEEWEVSASIEGGVPPYEVWWDVNGVPLLTEQGEDDSGGRPTFHATGVGEGKYTVHVTDSMGETVFTSTYREERQLHFSQQPEDAVLSEDGLAELSVTVDDGTPPYTFILSRNGRRAITRKSDSGSWTFSDLNRTGSYHVTVQDAEGHRGRSEHATISLPEFRIASQTLSAEFYGTLIQLGVRVEGGLPPYTYQWMFNPGDQWYMTGSDSPNLPVTSVGEYACRITDSDDNTIYAEHIPVEYRGENPWITQQPVGGAIPAGGSFTLQCSAISGAGNHTLRYDWQRKALEEGGSWTLWEWGRQTLETSRPGLYRCRITDTDTGKTTYSRTVTVYRNMCFVSAEMYAQVAPGTGRYHLSYEGGVPNYFIEVYLYDEATETVTIERTTRVEGTDPVLYLPLWTRATDGSNENIHATYCFVITDRYQQTCASGPVRW